jgi:hypothetical protein
MRTSASLLALVLLLGVGLSCKLSERLMGDKNAATVFIVWMLLPIVDDRLVRAEVGYLGATALLCAQLWWLHSATRRPAPRARRASTPA